MKLTQYEAIVYMNYLGNKRFSVVSSDVQFQEFPLHLAWMSILFLITQ